MWSVGASEPMTLLCCLSQRNSKVKEQYICYAVNRLASLLPLRTDSPSEQLMTIKLFVPVGHDQRFKDLASVFVNRCCLDLLIESSSGSNLKISFCPTFCNLKLGCLHSPPPAPVSACNLN